MDDWSDSDDEGPSGIETSVLLGVPDGPIDVPSDLSDAAVSRIGGHPAFLPSSEPPITSSHCKICNNPMELLVQMWCPFENSPMDRALYVWGCAKATCQKKQGSVRAWRGLRYNEKYAAKLKKKQEQKQKQKVEAEKPSKINPFSANITANAPAFGLGTQVFGEDLLNSKISGSENENEESDDDDDGSEVSSLLTAMTRTVISDSPWRSAPAYEPVYLSTVSEYLPPRPKQKLSSAAQHLDIDDATGAWMSEKYENSMNVDPIFGRFTRRVATEGEQCVRYELGGVPLPFTSDEVFQKLFPAPKRAYEPSGIEVCPACQSKRVFECQLMPNLINVLRRGGNEKKRQTEEERRADIARALNGGEGMSWGTCLVFSCSIDCTENEWREEAVYIEWDT